MTRWPKLWSLLTGEPALSDAQVRAADAAERRDEAQARGDDRAYGRAVMELRQAQHERLRLGQ